jgi:RNA-directed DNA polymerase
MKEIFKSTYPTQSGKGVSQGLAGVRKAARENKEMKFTALLHHLTVDLLRTKSTSGPLNCQSETDGPPVDEAWDGSPGAAGDETIRRVR